MADPRPVTPSTDAPALSSTERSAALIRAGTVLLNLILAMSGCLVIARAILGPFRLGIAVGSPITAETAFGVAAILLTVLRMRDVAETHAPVRLAKYDGLAFAALIAGGFAAWWWTLRFPFVAEDFAHIAHGIQATPGYLKSLFTVPAIDRFFRPFGYIAYAAEAQLLGSNRTGWHAASLLLHVGNSGLLYTIARKRGYRFAPAMAAGLLFLLHGSRPEAVTWIAAQFDLWAAFFFFLALLAFIHLLESGGGIWQIASLAALLFALLSKEEAYVFPILAVFLLWIDRVSISRWPRLLIPPFGLTALVFLYRWMLLGGIGGYTAGTGAPFFYSIGILRTGRALLLRPWAILQFPINWSVQPGWWLAICLTLGIAAMLALASRGSASRNKILFGLGFLIIAALPVHEFLLIGADLEKSRELYLPSAGFALLFAAALESMRPRVAIAIASGVLALQTAALEHNLIIWSRVARISERTCQAAAEAVERSPQPVLIGGLPQVIDGVYLLRNGFRECVEDAAGKPVPGMVRDLEPQPPGFHAGTVLGWNNGAQALRAAGR